MTRSVEIPEAAVAKGAERLWLFRTPIAKTRESCTEQAREVIEAALPYLAPAEVVIDHRPGETCSVAAEVDPETGFARAPAGDGGLREALAGLLRKWDEDRATYPKMNLAANHAEVAVKLCGEELADVVAAHPAAPAVPQPVDREALTDLLSDFVDSDDCWYDHHGYCQAHGWFRTDPACPHARAKAVLAGEQEQVEK